MNQPMICTVLLFEWIFLHWLSWLSRRQWSAECGNLYLLKMFLCVSKKGFSDRLCSFHRTFFKQAESAKNPVFVRSLCTPLYFCLSFTARCGFHCCSELAFQCRITFPYCFHSTKTTNYQIWPIFKICMFKPAGAFLSKQAFLMTWFHPATSLSESLSH